MRTIGLLLSCALAAAGCASKPEIRESRAAPTGIAAGEAIAIFLSANEQHTAYAEKMDWVEIEQRLESCLRREMLDERDGLRFVSPQELRQAAFPDVVVDELPKTAEAWLERLADARRDSALSRLRYVVMLDRRAWASDLRFETATTGVFGLTRKLSLSVNATVLDLVHRRVAGEVAASGRGERGGGVALFIIIPIPLFMSSVPDSRVCAGLAQALVRFIAQPHQ